MNKKSSDEQHETLSNVVKLRNALPNGSSDAVASACPHTSTSRVCWDCYFLAICGAVAQRADCLRAKHGCVITRDRRIISTGYNAAEAGGPSCLAGECPRGLLSYAEVKSLAGNYDSCISIHAEQNALLYANWSDTRGATLYVTGPQCGTCRKLAMGAGIARVVWPTGEEEFCQ